MHGQDVANHFLEGRTWRLDELGEAKMHGKWWRRGFWLQSGLLGLAVVGLISMGHRPQWKPYYIELDTQSGATRVVGPAPAQYIPPQATARAEVRRLIETLRGISTDKETMRESWRRVRLAMTAEGKRRLLEWEAERQPLRQQTPVKVEIVRALPKPGSGNTWDVRWQEIDYGRDDRDPARLTIWSALVSFKLREPRTQEELDYASAGIFFDFWQWSKE